MVVRSVNTNVWMRTIRQPSTISGTGITKANRLTKIPNIRWSTDMLSIRRTDNVMGRTHSEMSSIGNTSQAKYQAGPAKCLI